MVKFLHGMMEAKNYYYVYLHTEVLGVSKQCDLLRIFKFKIQKYKPKICSKNSKNTPNVGKISLCCHGNQHGATLVQVRATREPSARSVRAHLYYGMAGWSETRDTAKNDGLSHLHCQRYGGMSDRELLCKTVHGIHNSFGS